MSDQVVLECRDVKKEFKLGLEILHVLHRVDFVVKRGDMFAITGTSGSGKTTLLNLLAGLDTPSQGEIKVSGRSFTELSDKQRAKFRNQNLGFVFQFHHLLPEFSALDNVLMPCRIAGTITNEQQAYAKQLLSDVGLANRFNHRPGELSGGERQRVSIARALIHKPSIVLMDEPTGNLDEDTADQVQRLIFDLNKSLESSFIVVTHNKEWANQLPKFYTLTKGSLSSS